MVDQRVGARVPVDRRIICSVGGQASLVHLYDLSHDGCMITAPDQRIEVGGRLTIEFFDGLEASGKVVWRDLGHVGVLFDAALHPVVVLHLGWQQPAPSFASKAPADRFGRGLPALAPVERKPRGDLGRPRPVG
jgi:hypothetical protein